VCVCLNFMFVCGVFGRNVVWHQCRPMQQWPAQQQQIQWEGGLCVCLSFMFVCGVFGRSVVWHQCRPMQQWPAQQQQIQWEGACVCVSEFHVCVWRVWTQCGVAPMPSYAAVAWA